MKRNYECVIIGSGVAGMTSAIYLKRMNIDVLIIEKATPGGQIVKTAVIENYPGFTSISGSSLASQMYEQVTNLKIPYLYEDVITIKDNGKTKTIITNQNEITCKSIIIASGRSPKKLNLKNEEELIGHGISYCAICDGMLYKDQEVAIVGSGNSAFEECLYLAKICSKVTILNRSSHIKADSILKEKVKQLKNVEIKYNTEIKELKMENNKLHYLILNNNEILQVRGLFIFIGLIPELQFLQNTNIKLDNNYIVVDNKMQTNIKNIYACGDVIKKDVYQIATAIGEAATAAINVTRNINK